MVAALARIVSRSIIIRPSSISSYPTSISSIAGMISSLGPPLSVAFPSDGVACSSPDPLAAAASYLLPSLDFLLAFPSSNPSSFFSSGAGTIISCCLCATAWVAPSMPASRPSHGWRFCLIPCRPHYKIGYVTAESLPHPYEVHPWELIQCNKTTYHRRKISRPGGGIV